MTHSKVIIIAGPTASGKSEFAVSIAKKQKNVGSSAVIINADSQQVYKELPILSAQPCQEIQKEIPHALYSCFDSKTICSAGTWAQKASEEIKKAWKENKTPILCGGTGFYLLALINGLRCVPDIPIAYREKAIERLRTLGTEAFYKECLSLDYDSTNKLSPQDTHRLLRLWEVFHSTGKPLSWWHTQGQVHCYLPDTTIWDSHLLIPKREILYERINKRAEEMLKNGAIEEAKKLLNLNLPSYHPLMKAVGVQEIHSFLKKEKTYQEILQRIQQYTRNFAKRQITWFKHQYKEKYDSVTIYS